MKKLKLILALSAMTIVMTAQAGSGLSGGSSSSKSSSSSSSSSKSSPSSPARIIIPQASPQPSKSTGFSGGSGSRAPEAPAQQSTQKQVTVQGATAQTFAREAQKAAAVTTLTQIEQEKKATDSKASIQTTQNAQVPQPKSQGTSTNNAQPKSNIPPQVVIVERQQQSNNNDFWNGMVIGQILNRPSTVVVQTQPQTTAQHQSTTPNDNPSWNNSQGQVDNVDIESSSVMLFIVFFGMIAVLAAITYYVFARRASARATHKPNITLR